ncbi:MAG: nickel-dependent lactate racemase [Armatimonadetes bacterium]|nr:nickel-dependent lactate racemase [Armatimonadota bacterium]
MQVTLDYGREGLRASVPDSSAVLSLIPVAPLSDPQAAVAAALGSPEGTAPLADLAKGRRDACIVIYDITRPVPYRALLPPLLEELEEAGLPREAVTFLVATGLHRPCTPDELEEMLGPEVCAAYRIVNHMGRQRDTHRYLGETSTGIPVYIDETYCRADLKIATGLIEPHFMAGYSGGRKAIVPGIAAAETILIHHGPHQIEPESSSAGRVSDNRFHHQCLEATRMAAPDFLLNVTMDESRRPTGVFAGDWEKAWASGVAFLERGAKIEVAEPFDIAVTTSAGYPLDATFYQAIKGMMAPLPVLKPGGTILLASACSEGIGGREFTDTLLGAGDLEALVARFWEPGFVILDQWNIQELAKIRRKAEVLCFSEGIPPETQKRLFVTPVPSVEAGLESALAQHGPSARIAVMPKGPYVLPVLKE